MRKKSIKSVLLFIVIILSAGAVNAQPPGWQDGFPITVYENSGTTLTNHQVPITLNTQALIAAGLMNANGDDIRFATSCTGGLLPYWIEGYMNTDTTKIWVQVNSIPANDSVTIMMFYGNSLASPQSDIAIFEGPFSGNDSLTGGSPGGSGDRQRGFYFHGSRDILVTKFGKYEPTGTTRYVTLFDSISQTLMNQIQVPGPAATLSYGNLASPVWLTRDQTYLITVFLQTGDQYYISSSTQAGPYLTYSRTGWCNTCTQNTFPLNNTTGHFGYPDFEYYVRDSASIYPTYQFKSQLTALAGMDVEICSGDSVLMATNATGGAGFNQYQWSPGVVFSDPAVANPYAFPLITGEVTFSVMDDLGCTNSDTLIITVNALPGNNLGPDLASCDSYLIDGTLAGVSYLWNTTEITPTITVTSSGDYSLVASDLVTGCSMSDTVNIVINSASVNLGADAIVCDTITYTLDAGTASSYLWDDNSTNQTLIVSATGTYSVEITDGNGCIAMDTITITFIPCSASIGELEDKISFIVYPNPTTGQLTVSIPEEFEANGMLYIINAKGQVAHSLKIQESVSNIDLRELADGVYQLKLQIGQITETKRLVLKK